ncbi:carboxylesterase [Oceanicola sp. 502str15]|uniref:alpha/beta hydrolase n=1 Tax=Oceanicola sp. 502str15 TaxID=2696061 RepID=UPI0020942DB3|nr:alpha/beta hydrolase [Oceanicola sp. 502str15]MCO6382990.1 alpha/beta hydrolase [Oceanicola sp. 502str15]
MRPWLRWTLAVFALLAVIWVVAPRAPVDTEISFDPTTIGLDVDAYLAQGEQQFSDIVPGTEKQVIWAGEPGTKTPLAVIYVHGYSAAAPEIAPVPQQVARALGANLYFTRLSGHGRSEDAMAEPTAGDWLEDMAETMAIAERIGERSLILATSTGATLATSMAAAHPEVMSQVEGMVFVAPNFAVNSRAAFLLRAPFVRHWLPLVLGERRGFTPINEAQARYWTERYPVTALLPMAALVHHARTLDHARIPIPVLFYFSDEDQVVSPVAARRVAADWGGPVTIINPELTAADDPWSHVIAGDIVSPGQTEAAVAAILDWAKGL